MEQTQNQNLPARKSGKRTIKDLLSGDEFKRAVAAVLPKHVTAERFVRVALTATIKTPLLADCDQHSFFNSLLTLSQLGLEPDGRRAHLIPFRNNKRGTTDCQLIIDYKGLVELAMRSGTVANIHADVVCENDGFDYDRGQLLRHRIDFRKPRGNVYAVYALCRFKDGTEKCEVMTKEEVESIRARSKAAQNGPWVTDWNEMAKKTVFKRLSKWLTLSPEFRDALDVDDKAETIIEKSATTIDAPMFQIPERSAPEPKAPVFDAPAAPAPAEDDIPYGNIGTNTDAAPAPAPTPKPPTPQAGKKSNQDQLEDWWLGEVGSTFDEFQAIVIELGEEDASSWTCFQDMHGQTARKYLNAKAGLLAERKNRMAAGEGSAR